MRRSQTPILLGLGLAVIFSHGASAQRVGDVVVEPPSPVMDVTPEDSERVERYVRAETDVPVIEEHLTLRPGSIIPDGVTLRLFPKDTQLARLSYFVSIDNKIVVADPRTRTVVRIIDKKG